VHINPKESSKSDTGISESLQKMMESAMSEVSGRSLRKVCLELAVCLPDLTGADEAIAAAKKFEEYLLPSKETK
jgi:hypothetical protein